MNGNKSLGSDNLHSNVLKEVATEIVHTLVVTFQNSMDSNVVATDLKIENVNLLFHVTEHWSRL